jgi:CheY-like chemotaxis protein
VRALSSSKAAGVPAIALSAHVRQEDVEEALASGFQMHLSKPIEPSKLLSAVTSTLLHNWQN